MNYTNLTMNLWENYTSNTGCQSECQKVLSNFANFHANITSVMHTRFIVAVCTLILFSFIKLYLEYGNHSMSDETYFFISKRVDWIIAVIGLCTIALLFI